MAAEALYLKSKVWCSHMLRSRVRDKSDSDITNGDEGSDWKEVANGGNVQSQTGFY
jgi:hypothetical protein